MRCSVKINQHRSDLEYRSSTNAIQADKEVRLIAVDLYSANTRPDTWKRHQELPRTVYFYDNRLTISLCGTLWACSTVAGSAESSTEQHVAYLGVCYAISTLACTALSVCRCSRECSDVPPASPQSPLDASRVCVRDPATSYLK